MTDPRNRLIVALDFPSLESALALVRALRSQVSLFKVGLELFNAAGPGAIAALRELGARVFYDAKFHDIPNTVAGAAAAAGRMGVWMVNVHAPGGRAMMQAAKQGAARGAAEAGFPPPLVIGVTVLTSLSDSDLSEELGFSESAEQTVLRLAQLAKAAGLDGVVASVREAADIRQMCGREFVIVTPGIRPAWAEAGDQARIATPRAALEAGADYLVIGRPITHADDPRQALSRVLDEMAA
jgi:orotidine-5'-phosphate decarboxylase